MRDHATPVAVLKMARALLDRGWCQDALAKTTHGEPCPPLAPTAASWSLLGVLLRATSDMRRVDLFDSLRDEAREVLYNKTGCLLFAVREPDARVACWVIEQMLAIRQPGP